MCLHIQNIVVINFPDLKMQFDDFFNVIHECLIKFETFFCMVVLSDLWPLYTHTFQSNEFELNWLNFYLKW